MQSIETPRAPQPAGHYSQAIVHGGLVYVAGQLPVVPGDPGRRPEGFEAEARQVVANVIAVVEAAGSSADRILRATVYVSDIADWPAFNRVYAELLGSHRPARTVVPVATLHHGYRVEMDAIAALRDPPTGS